MGVNGLPKTVTRQRRGCDLNPGPSAPESSALTTRLPSHPEVYVPIRPRFRSNFTHCTQRDSDAILFRIYARRFPPPYCR